MTKHFLIVDDLQENLQVLRKVLSTAYPDCRITSKVGGEAALQAVQRDPPDIVLLDARMPDIDGFEVCRRIKSNPARSHILVLMVSGYYITPPDMVTGWDNGADGYLAKPYTFNELLEHVERLVNISDDLKALRESRLPPEEKDTALERLRLQCGVKFRMLFENAPDAILMLSAEGVLLDCNPAAERLLGGERGSLAGKNLQEKLPAEATGEVSTILRRTLGDGGAPRGGEAFSRVRIGGQLLELMGRCIDFAGGSAVLLYCRDITDRQRVEQALQIIARGVASTTGFSFFVTLTEQLSQALEADVVLLGERTEDDDTINTLALCTGGETGENISFKLSSSPFADLTLEKCIICTRGAGERPVAAREPWSRWRMESFLAVPLMNSEGRCAGILAIISRHPLVDAKPTVSILQIFAARAAAELERKRAAAELWKSEQRHRSLTDDVLDTSAIGMLLQDGDRRIVWMNRAFEKLFGLRREAAAGEKIEKLRSRLARRLTDRRLLNSIMAGKVGSAELPAEAELPAVDGQPQCYVSLWSQPVRSGWYAGGTMLQVADITARKQTERERNRLAMAVEQSGEAIFITAVNGSIEYVNPAFERISGYRRSEAVGKTPRLLSSGEHDADFYRNMWNTLKSGGNWRGRLINRRRDGTLFDAEEVISPIRDEQGRLAQFITVMRDLSHEAELERQFRQSQKMESVGRLAGGIAHDFNNLLTSILGFSRLIEEESDDPEAVRQDIQEVIRAGEHASRLSRQLLSFGRRQPAAMQPVALNDSVREMDQLLRRTLGEDVELVTVLGEDIGRIRADSGLLEQVIMNLAVNGRDAMPAGGKLTIETGRVELNELFCCRRVNLSPGAYVRLRFSDNGSGMAPEIVEHAFEPFYTTKEKGKGTGLGLFTVYGIVKQFQGHIEIDSRSEEGTTVSLYFPELPETASTQQRQHVSSAPLSGGEETILVVEDEATVRNLTVRMLSGLGYRVYEASNGEAALGVCRERGAELDLRASCKTPRAARLRRSPRGVL